MTDKRFTGKVAVVCGGASSLGAVISEAFHKSGASVAVAGRSERAGNTLMERLGDRLFFQRTDITDDGQIDSFVAATIERFGRIDFLVNNAVSYQDDGIGSSRKAWLDSFNVNVVGGARMLSAVRPHIRKAGGGAVVNIGSIAAKTAQKGRALYPVTKSAILHLTRVQAVELAAENIRVNTVSPAWTWSRPIADATNNDRAKADRVGAELHPLGRIADAEEVASVVLFACSQEASFVTGADIPVDGGHSIIGPDGGIPQQYRLRE